ncbi:MAG: hypothetical protein Q7J29_01380 [Stagnimonas sp.]|nr:hypothetical protein [Stagnimonas sp.]
MIAKAPEAPSKRIGKSASTPRRKLREPLDVRLTFKINFGNAPEDAVTVMNERRVPMVNSVFDQRDRIVRTFAMSLVRVGLAQPKVVREVFPAMKLLRKLKKALP